MQYKELTLDQVEITWNNFTEQELLDVILNTDELYSLSDQNEAIDELQARYDAINLN